MAKGKRQKVYVRLRARGFLVFEALVLSKFPTRIQYFGNMIKARSRVKARAMAKGWSIKQYEAYIRAGYTRRGWTTLDKDGNTIASVWAMLRAFEDRYKDRHPEYTSPWVKKQKDFKNFQSKFEAGQEKYPRGAAYKGKGK